MVRQKTTTGFTLVELLVVISIISMLMAILMPSLSKAREKAKETECMTRLHSIGQAIHIYSTNHDESAVPGDCSIPWDAWAIRTDSACEPGSMREEPVNIGHLLVSRLLPVPNNDKSVIFCPSSRSTDGEKPNEDFVDYWGIRDLRASITYMYNISIDGFRDDLKEGNIVTSPHKDVINFACVDGSVRIFRDKPLPYKSGLKRELLYEVMARKNYCFPQKLLHEWFSNGEVDLDEANDYLASPTLWYQKNGTSRESEPLTFAKLDSNTSLLSDLVGVRSTVSQAPG